MTSHMQLLLVTGYEPCSFKKKKKKNQRSLYPTIRRVSSLLSIVRLSAKRRQGVGVRPLTDQLCFQLLPWLLPNSFTHWDGSDKRATQGAHHWMKQARRDFLMTFLLVHQLLWASYVSYGLYQWETGLYWTGTVLKILGVLWELWSC